MNSDPIEIIHMSVGGPIHRISVNGKIITFEMHGYCGPIALKKNGDALKDQPKAFLEAASLWAQQGKQVGDDGLCIWHREPKPIMKHRGGRHYDIVGYEPAERGQ